MIYFTYSPQTLWALPRSAMVPTVHGHGSCLSFCLAGGCLLLSLGFIPCSVCTYRVKMIPRTVSSLGSINLFYQCLPVCFSGSWFLTKASFGGLKGDRDLSHKRQIGHKPLTHILTGPGWGWTVLAPPWWCLGAMPTALSSRWAEHTRIQSAPSCRCNEDNGPCSKELEFINIWSVPCCQTQLLLLHIVLLFALAYKLFHPILQWAGAGDQSGFVSAQRLRACRRRAHPSHAHHGILHIAFS